MRRLQLASIALIAAAAVLTHAASRPAVQRTGPPNVLLIQADDLGYGDLSAYGQSRFQTPALDRLAREGTRFTQYYAGSTVCAPSRAALMTGMHTGHGWIRGNGGLPGGDVPLRPDDVTMAEVLRDSGIARRSSASGASASRARPASPTNRDSTTAFGFLDHRHAHRQFTDHLWRNGEMVRTDLDHDYVNDLFTREAAAFIERSDTRPFFVYLNYTVPHAELRVPDDSMEPFRGKFAERPFANPTADGTPTGARPEGPSLGYRSQPAAVCGVRGDDHAHGPRRRPPRGPARSARHRSRGRWCCSSATTVPIRKAAAIRCSSRAPADCAASSGISTRVAFACR